MKKILILILIFGLLGVGVVTYYKYNTYTMKEVPANLSNTPVVKASIIDKKMIVQALTQKGQLVGLEGSIIKTVIYQDQTLNTDFSFINEMSKRTFMIDAKVNFKMGYNLNEIKSEQVSVMNDAIRIITPQPILVSMDIPYDEMEISDKHGILCSSLTDKEKQQIYTKLRDTVKNELLTDPSIKAKANQQTQEQLKLLLANLSSDRKIIFY